MREFRLVPLHELVGPEHAARTTMDDTKLDSLVSSIRELGIIEPLLVMTSDNGKLEVVAGDRRLRAARVLGLGEAPCIIVKDGPPRRKVPRRLAG